MLIVGCIAIAMIGQNRVNILQDQNDHLTEQKQNLSKSLKNSLTNEEAHKRYIHKMNDELSDLESKVQKLDTNLDSLSHAKDKVK